MANQDSIVLADFVPNQIDLILLSTGEERGQEETVRVALSGVKDLVADGVPLDE